MSESRRHSNRLPQFCFAIDIYQQGLHLWQSEQQYRPRVQSQNEAPTSPLLRPSLSLSRYRLAAQHNTTGPNKTHRLNDHEDDTKYALGIKPAITTNLPSYEFSPRTKPHKTTTSRHAQPHSHTHSLTNQRPSSSFTQPSAPTSVIVRVPNQPHAKATLSIVQVVSPTGFRSRTEVGISPPQDKSVGVYLRTDVYVHHQQEIFKMKMAELWPNFVSRAFLAI